VVGCYLDFTSLVIEDPNEMLVTDSFFLCGASIVIAATQEGLMIR
jgi:hypothetical protein